MSEDYLEKIATLKDKNNILTNTISNLEVTIVSLKRQIRDLEYEITTLKNENYALRLKYGLPEGYYHDNNL